MGNHSSSACPTGCGESLSELVLMNGAGGGDVGFQQAVHKRGCEKFWRTAWHLDDTRVYQALACRILN